MVAIVMQEYGSKVEARGSKVLAVGSAIVGYWLGKGIVGC